MKKRLLSMALTMVLLVGGFAASSNIAFAQTADCEYEPQPYIIAPIEARGIIRPAVGLPK